MQNNESIINSLKLRFGDKIRLKRYCMRYNYDLSNFHTQPAAPRFLEYLSGHRKLSSYFREFHHTRHLHDYNVLCYLMSEMPEDYVRGAFGWVDSKEGREFWSTFCFDWEQYYTAYFRR